MKTSTCQYCSKLFTQSGNTPRKFCSLSCSCSFNGAKVKEKKLSLYTKTPTLCQCCNNPLPYHSRLQKFCSRSCSATVINSTRTCRTGPIPKEKLLFSKVKFIWCSHTNQYYLNKNPNGTTRRCSPYIKTIKEQYYNNARFKFNVYHYPEEFNLSLIDQHGWYTCPGKKRKNGTKNIFGVSRDHIISVSYGFANNIDPKIISHPANCRIVLHAENKKKHSNCGMSLAELIDKIKKWN
jgi:hypothetical protein